MAQNIKFPRINNVMISGHLTREVELRYTPNGKPIARIGIAFNRVYLNAEGNWIEDANFIDVKAFGKQAELCAERLHKGSPVIFEGYINTSSFTDRENQPRKTVEINVSKVHFLEKNVDTSEQNEDSFERNSQSVTDDDVPF
jgi:single-strand DNA-binding protein